GVPAAEAEAATLHSGVDIIRLDPLRFEAEFQGVLSLDPTRVVLDLAVLTVGPDGFEIPRAQAGEAGDAHGRVGHIEIRRRGLENFEPVWSNGQNRQIKNDTS